MNTYLQQAAQRLPAERRSDRNAFHPRDVLARWRLVLGTGLLIALLGSLHALTVEPVYQANLLVQIKRAPPVGNDAAVDTPASTEVEILRSRSVLAGVVASHHLDISVEPMRVPVVGAYLARGAARPPTPGLFDLRGYAWAGEYAKVTAFALPRSLIEKPFVLQVTGKDTYRMTQDEAGIDFTGRAGALARSATPQGEIAVLVTQWRGHPGARFTVTRSSPFHAVDRLQRSLVISEHGKQSNVIGMSLKGSDPELISGILNAIGAQYMRRHADQQAGENGDLIAFYNRQLEESRARLQRLDARSARLHGMHEAADLAEESRILSQQALTLQDKLAEAQHGKAELSSRYLSAHPAMIVADDRIRRLESELNQIRAKRRALAASEQEIVAVRRDRQENADLNAALLGVRQKLDALGAPGRTDVRLIDRAEIPYQPVNLGLRARVALACLAGLIGGILAAVLKTAMAGSRRPPPPRYDSQFRLV